MPASNISHPGRQLESKKAPWHHKVSSSFFFKKRLTTSSGFYPSGYKYREPKLTEAVQVELESFKEAPLFSIIVPVASIHLKWLRKTIQSVKKQWYSNWQLCVITDFKNDTKAFSWLQRLCDDQDTRVILFCCEHKNSLSRMFHQGLTLADGDFVSLLGDSDLLTPDALFEVVRIINKDNPDFIYSDEDSISSLGRFCKPLFKPDYSYYMLCSQNYIGQLAVIRKNLLSKSNNFAENCTCCFEHGLFLKTVEQTERISHIAKVLYHRRESAGIDTGIDSCNYCREHIIEHFQRQTTQATVTTLQPKVYRVQYKLTKEPLVSIIIPFKDKPELLKSF